MKRAYSLLQIKSVSDSDGKRIIKGIATTPTPDRMGDIVEPMGAKFKTPMPLLWMHNHGAPVGHVTFAKPTRKGIPFEAEIVQVEEPGTLKDRVDEAWHSVKYKLVTAVSIGFRAFHEAMEFMETGGIRFKEWEWMELSLVSIPANPEAVIYDTKAVKSAIMAVKSFDRQLRAASGQSVTDLSIPGDSGRIKDFHSRKDTDMDINQQVADLAEQRDALVTEMKSFGDVTELDDEQAAQYDELSDQYDVLEKQLTRAKKMQAAMGTARPVEGVSRAAASQSRAKAPGFIKREDPDKNLEPGVAFARIAKMHALAKRDGAMSARDYAKHYYGPDSGAYRHFTKAPVPAANTQDPAWAGALVGEETSAFADFVEFLRPQTILGRFGTDGIPALRVVPFRVALIGQISGGDGYWVGEGQPKPLTRFDFNRRSLEPRKVANIAVATMEVLRDSSPSADLIIRDSLAAALRERMDLDFVDPAKAEVADVSPASITNDVTPIPSSGPTADNVRQDIKAVFDQFIADNNAPTNGVWIMSATTALSLSLMYNPLGQREFPSLSMTGGTLFGLPVIVSEYVPADSSGAVVILVNASDVYLGDEGGVAVDLSTEASLQMLDNPTNDSITPTATPLVSMFQTNSVAFRAERTINWLKRRQDAVAMLSGVQWGDV